MTGTVQRNPDRSMPTASAVEHPGAATPPAVTADDPRYESLLRGTNHRFVPRPGEVRIATTTEQVVAVVADAAATGRRIAVRSGGHGFEDFAASPDAQVLLDLSEMTEVRFDAERRAFSVQPGATLGHVYRVLFKGWGVTVPGGECAEVGVGGHFAGGGYGPLSRRDGSIVDYLHAVEVVVVDEHGRPRVVVATDDPADPHHDLWWAHTGGGGGNFGVVTRYWLRRPGPLVAEPADPADLLPPAPARWRTAMLLWSWEGLEEADFTAILRNFGGWFERNSDPDSPARNLTGFVAASHRSGFGVSVGASIDADVPDAQQQVDRYLAAVTAGVTAAPAHREQKVRPWLYGAAYPGWGDPGTIDARRIKIKAAYLRRGYRDAQLATIYRHLSGGEPFPIELILIGYGGRVNAVDPAATATAQRDSILKAAYLSVWADQADDDATIARLREMYRDVYAESGGVPVPDEVSDGSYINYPDVDLADPVWNTSGVPWHDLYYKDNHPRLQRVKRRYDPGNVFRHALSIEPSPETPAGVSQR